MSLPRCIHACGITLLLAVAATSQAQSKPPLTFKANSRLVQINVIVDGQSGPVTGLQANDFAIADNGKPRTIAVFSADDESGIIAAPPAPAPAGSAPAGGGAPPATYSNVRRRAAIMVVILLDALDSRDGAWYCYSRPEFESVGSFVRAKQGTLRYIQQLDPQVRVALIGLDSQLRVLADFTNDRARLLAALEAYRPQTVQQDNAAGSGEEVIAGVADGISGDFNALNAKAAAHFQQEMVQTRQKENLTLALAQISSHLADLPGRISLVWIMNGPPLPGNLIAAALARTNVAVYAIDARGLLPRLPRISTAEVHPSSMGNICGRGIGPYQAQPPGIAEMQDVAEATGGRAFVNTNDITGAIAGAAADSRESYTLGFYLDAGALDGDFHHLSVRVRRRGLEVRYPHGYWATRDEDAAPARDLAALEAALRSPLDATALPLKASLTQTGSDGAKELHLTAHLDIHNLTLTESAGRRAGTVVLETVSQDVSGAPLQTSRWTVHLHWSEAQYQSKLQTGMAFEQTILPEEGATTLRVLVEDPATAAVGSLIIPIARP